jgi:hypothetical protein
MASPRQFERYPERKPDTMAGAYTWRCRTCGRTLLLTHKHKWLGQGRQRRRICAECYKKREAK